MANHMFSAYHLPALELEVAQAYSHGPSAAFIRGGGRPNTSATHVIVGLELARFIERQTMSSGRAGHVEDHGRHAPHPPRSHPPGPPTLRIAPDAAAAVRPPGALWVRAGRTPLA